MEATEEKYGKKEVDFGDNVLGRGQIKIENMSIGFNNKGGL